MNEEGVSLISSRRCFKPRSRELVICEDVVQKGEWGVLHNNGHKCCLDLVGIFVMRLLMRYGAAWSRHAMNFEVGSGM